MEKRVNSLKLKERKLGNVYKKRVEPNQQVSRKSIEN